MDFKKQIQGKKNEYHLFVKKITVSGILKSIDV